MIEIEKLEALKETDKITVAAHADADGIAAACLFTSVIDAQVEPQKKFGYCSTNTNVMLDMKPKSAFEGICIDHHPDHPLNPPYTLIWEDYPTSLIVWELWRNHIPKNKWWYVAVGLMGDGQQYLIPKEVFKEERVLLNRSISAYPRTGEVSVYDYPVWMMLSSPINALCKTGQERTAYSILSNCSSPLELLSNPIALEAKDALRAETNKQLQNGIFMSIGEVILGLIDSQYAVEKDIATKLEQETHKTAIVINERDKSVSIRGVLSTLLKEIFDDKTVLDIGGHAGFMGATLIGRYEDVLQRLKDIQ